MLTSYFRYLLTRKNEFRIHSPFVFALYTKVLKGGHEEVLPSLGIERVLKVTALPEEPDPKAMYEIEGIHKNKNNEQLWDTICACRDVTLTIDQYHKGLFFYREGMEKQEFVLKK